MPHFPHLTKLKLVTPSYITMKQPLTPETASAFRSFRHGLLRWWTESRCDSVCLRSRHFEAWHRPGLTNDFPPGATLATTARARTQKTTKNPVISLYHHETRTSLRNVKWRRRLACEFWHRLGARARPYWHPTRQDFPMLFTEHLITFKKLIMQVPDFTTCYVRSQSAQAAGRVATGFPLPSTACALT